MRNIQFVGHHFGPGINIEHGMVVLRVLLNALYEIDCDQWRRNPQYPGLGESGVVYKREPKNTEEWQDVTETLERGYGDCEDLACMLASEITVRHDIDARPDFTLREMPREGQSPSLLFHIFVRLPNGKRIDPSRLLGMGRNDG
jgi:hypothetical protein